MISQRTLTALVWLLLIGPGWQEASDPRNRVTRWRNVTGTELEYLIAKISTLDPSECIDLSDSVAPRVPLAAASRILSHCLDQFPDSFLLRSSAALALSLQGKLEDAIDQLEAALALVPADAVCMARLLFTRAQICDWRGQVHAVRALDRLLRSGRDCNTGLKGPRHWQGNSLHCMNPALQPWAQ